MKKEKYLATVKVGVGYSDPIRVVIGGKGVVSVTQLDKNFKEIKTKSRAVIDSFPQRVR